MAYKGRAELYVSPITYAAIFYLLRKQGWERMRLLLRNFRQLSRVTTVNEQVVDNALASDFSDYEDALQYYSALSCDVEAIITRNAKDFTLSQISVLTPDEFLEVSKRE